MTRITPTLRDQIALTLIPGIGDVLQKNLISYCGSAEAVFKEKKAKLLKIPGIGEVLAQAICGFKSFDAAEKELAFIEKHQIQCYYYLDENYPYRLRDIADAPCLLFGLGNMNLNPTRMVGIVGTRKASDYGRAFTQTLVADLAMHNIQVVSGLALGIDGIAHKACVQQEIPTIGILAHGLDRLYPPQHQALAKKMLANGGLLTECLSGTNPDRENFPKRNRIVAGLCDVLILPETAIKGGARITAEIAYSYNKEMMALPGRVSDYYSQGCNYLIQEQKAHMITCANDLIQLMGWQLDSKPSKRLDLFNQLSEAQTALISCIRSKVKIGIDELAVELSADAGTLALQLLELECMGLVRALPGKWYEIN
jgi:DNA processing protein